MKIRTILIDRLVQFLHSKGFQIIKEDELKMLTAHYWNVVIKKKNSKRSNRIDSIVYSKDRAIQLHAFLESFEKMVSNRGRMYILYKTSNESHKKSYLELQKLYDSENYVFVEEYDFRKQLIELSENSDAKIIGSFVDDQVFLIEIDYSKILKLDMEEYVVSLSRGKDLNEHPGRQLVLPEFEKRDDGFESFRWDYSESYSHWTYPVGVGAYFFDMDEWVVMLRSTMFKAPNTLEGRLQKFVPLFIKRKGICLPQISCPCIHANLVQTECNNEIIGTHTIEELLDKWEKGYKIDLNEFYGKSGMIAMSQSYNFRKR
jgi:hypothetical protein